MYTNIIDDIHNEIKTIINSAFVKCGFPSCDWLLETPKDKQFGDFSTNAAMALAKQEKGNPRAIAQQLVDNMDFSGSSITKAQVAGAGFINFYLDNLWLYRTLEAIEQLGDKYGCSDYGRGKKIMVEFVSANPTGPMHMGNARGGALGDSLANLLEMSGFSVVREFYLNDAGNQIEKFTLSLEARYLAKFGVFPFPEDGYHGADITRLAEEFAESKNIEKYGMESSAPLREALTKFGLERNIAEIKRILGDYQVRHDIWFNESQLYSSGEVDKTIADLKAIGATYEKDGALWLRSGEKDEVLVRANGVPTYFAADIAYHRNKFITRGFDRVINVWGADHHGHIARMKEAMSLLGIDPECLVVITMQLVRLMRGGEVARMSKRTGEAVTLEELLNEIGPDAARFFFNMRSAGSHFDFDLDLAVEQSNNNPVFYVQYAHARICSILRGLAKDGVTVQPTNELDVSVLSHVEELVLLRKLAEFPGEIRYAAEALEPSRMTRYAMDLASLFHSFYSAHRVRVEDTPLMAARLKLIDSVRVVLRNVLKILGVTAPDEM